MVLKGLQKLTLLDYPGEIAATVFTGGCNFRCPFCHNALLVERPGEAENISEEKFFDFLKKSEYPPKGKLNKLISKENGCNTNEESEREAKHEKKKKRLNL